MTGSSLYRRPAGPPVIRECENCPGLAATQAGDAGVCPPESGRVEDSPHNHIAVPHLVDVVWGRP